MSYILDALQRADAERERGGVPSLHTRPIGTVVGATGKGSGIRKGTGLAIAGGLILTLAAAGGWMWMGNPQPAAVEIAAPTQVAPRAIAIAAAVPAFAPAATSAQPPKPLPSAPSAAPQRLASGTAKVSASPAPLLGELPEDLRRQIPALGITGAVYSDNPAQRLLLVNGQVLAQGSQAAPDVTLVEIRSTHSEFSFRGTRFRVAH
jgi:general secretion pathway protein B